MCKSVQKRLGAFSASAYRLLSVTSLPQKDLKTYEHITSIERGVTMIKPMSNKNKRRFEASSNSAYGSPPFTDFESIATKTSIKELNLNWREEDLPEKIRTKHVHRLHPYLGKFIPQLVEIFLRKYSPKVVCDPFCGSGTTLVEANALGTDSVGCDISAFNCLLSKVKTDRYDVIKLEKEIKDILAKMKYKEITRADFWDVQDTDNEYLKKWFATKARKQLLYFLSLIPNYEYQDVMKIILSRSARSARLTTHYDLDFPKQQQTGPYYCFKHRRTCKPTDDALEFLRRYSYDTIKRIKEFSKIRTSAKVEIICGDAREVDFPEMDMVFTSPPYVGLIDYHQQHRYAYELLNLEWREEQEIGPAFKGTSKTAKEEYVSQIGEVLLNVRRKLKDNGVVVIVVNDKDNLYKDMAPKIGFSLEDKIVRHVNRRTGRRANNFFEEVLIWREK